MIDLYIRDHALWKTKRKTETARQWIAEVRDHERCRGARITPKMVTEFVRAQEKNFEKALQRSKGLSLPPPNSIKAGEVDLDLDFNGLLGIPRSSRLEVQRICPYYHQLYHAFAPGPTSFGTRVRESATSKGDVEIIASDPSFSPTMVIDNDVDEGFSTAPPSIFDPPSRASSRSTSGSPEIPEFTFQTVSHGFPPRPIPKQPVASIPSVISTSLATSSTRFYCNISSATIVRTAPLPVLVPKTLGVEIASHVSDTDAVTPQLNALTLGTTPIPQSLGVVAVGRKRKRTPGNVASSDLERVHDEPVRKHHREMLDREDQTIIELRTSFGDAKHSTTTQFGNSSLSGPSAPPTCAPKYCSSPPKSSLVGIPVPKVEISNGVCSSMIASLEEACNLLTSKFEPYESPVTNVRKRRRLEDEIHKFCKEIGGPKCIPSRSAPKLRSLATKMSRLCHIRRQLSIAYPSSQSRPYLQKRHREERTEPAQILSTWLREHATAPYPTRQEKEGLSKKTGLSVRAIRDWFRNARSGRTFIALCELT